MNLEQRARCFAEELQRLYFEERDIDSILAVLDQDVILFGFGREEIRFGREDMTAWLLAERRPFRAPSGSWNPGMTCCGRERTPVWLPACFSCSRPILFRPLYWMSGFSCSAGRRRRG